MSQRIAGRTQLVQARQALVERHPTRSIIGEGESLAVLFEPRHAADEITPAAALDHDQLCRPLLVGDSCHLDPAPRRTQPLAIAGVVEPLDTLDAALLTAWAGGKATAVVEFHQHHLGGPEVRQPAPRQQGQQRRQQQQRQRHAARRQPRPGTFATAPHDMPPKR